MEFLNSIKTPNIFKFDVKEEIGEISYETFASYIFSPLNALFDPEKEKIYQTEDHPFNSYFCSSSHNTYLIGHQLYGKPSFEGYERSLEMGNRCLEIDCWNGPKAPVVTHGMTLCSKLLFKDVIE